MTLMRRVLAVLAVFMLVAVAAPAGAKPNRDATLNISGTVAVGLTVTFKGCGYVPNVGVSVVVNGPTATSFMGDMADENGCFDTTDTSYFPLNNTGEYVVKTYQSNRNRADATASFVVQ